MVDKILAVPDKNQNKSQKKGQNKSQNKPETAPVVEPACLCDINFTIKKGALVAVIGPVGSGKSSLLNALTGEMERLEGTMARRQGTTVAVASQIPWIVNKSLLENIVFGSVYDESWYKQVIKACKLETDLEALPGGDQCEIGEKGINLR